MRSNAVISCDAREPSRAAQRDTARPLRHLMRPLVFGAGAVLLFTAQAAAQSAAPATGEPAARGGGNAYCDYVLGVASAESALMFAPSIYAQHGDIDQTELINGTATQVRELRTTVGMRIRFDGIFEGVLTRQRATADCQRQRALAAIAEVSAYEAYAAKIAVLANAMREAEQLRKRAVDDAEAHRIAVQDALATRLRVNDLKEQLAIAEAALAALPKPSAGMSAKGALAAYIEHDTTMEAKSAALRRMKAWDFSLRFGYDQLSERATSSPTFFLVSASFNLGGLFQSPGNRRAARGRRAMLFESQGALADMSVSRITAGLDIEKKRLEETSILVRDLEAQLAELKSLGGDTTRRFRDTVWFELVKAKADQAYLATHVATLTAVVEGAPK